MNIKNVITEDSIFSEIDRICVSNDNIYTPKAKAARVNAALDRFLSLAFQADNRWSFDDINQTSPPIDTQNIVSGTNRYKFSAFTEKILNLIRLEVLDSAGKGVYLTPEIWGNFNVSAGNQSGRISNAVIEDTFQELYINASSGTPTHYIKYGDFIYLRPNPNYAYTAGLKAYFNRPASKFVFTTFTVTIASPAVFTAAAHGLAANDSLILATDGALATGLTADTIIYYVISAGLTADAFEVSATLAGSAVNTSGTQSGNHSFLKANKEPGVPAIFHPYLARYAALPFLIEKEKPQTAAIAALIRQDELEIQNFFSQRDKDAVRRMIPKITNTR